LKKLDFKTMQFLVDKSQFSPDTYGEQYQDKLNKFLQKSELSCEYAIFLYFIRENYDNAEYYYKKALPLSQPDGLVGQIGMIVPEVVIKKGT
jgi:hypothetical protein